MKKRDYKEQERQRRYYFFDYLFWLGEMAQRHYKGEPRRPDGESMLMLCIMIFIYEPIFLTTAHFLFDSTVFEWFTVAMIAGIVAILHYLSNGRIYPFSRREAVMQHYEGRRFSPFRCYFFLFSLGNHQKAEGEQMESTVMETAISQGIWAVLAVFLLIYIVKSNEQRDAKQEEREKNYQTVIENLTEKFQILNQVQNDLKEIKDNLLNKN